MEIKRISKGQMPAENQYIWVFISDKPPAFPGDPGGPQWRIVKCIYGISRSERFTLYKSGKLADKRRSLDFRPEDEGISNLKPYCFIEINSCSYCGQDIDIWCALPPGVLAALNDGK